MLEQRRKIRQQEDLQRPGVSSQEAHYIHTRTEACRPGSSQHALPLAWSHNLGLVNIMSRWLPWHSQTKPAQNTQTEQAVSPSQQQSWPAPLPTISSHSYCNLPKGKKGKQFTDIIITCSAMWTPPLNWVSCLPNTAAKIAPTLGPNQRREEFKEKKKMKILLDSKTHNALGPHLINLEPLMSTASKPGMVHSQTHSRRVNMIWCWHRPITVRGSNFQFMDAVNLWQ